jgi:serine/threonine-protein kinase RsbW
MTSHIYEVVATVEAVSGVVGWAERVALAHGALSSTSANALLVCLQELVANVALHARRGDGAPALRVHLRIIPEFIAVLIEDNGYAFDPLRDAPVHVETDLASAVVGGRGLLIVRQLARAMSYERASEWNRLYLEIA